MSVSISKNKKYISISFYNINYYRIFSLLTLLKIEKLSILVDEKDSYFFNNCIFTNEFIEYVTKLNESVLIFDGYVKECFINKEIETLSNCKILIGIDLGENYVSILINNNNTNISINEIKQIFNTYN